MDAGAVASPALVLAVQGLTYGDEGKGTTVDFLARQFGAPLVVRFNGGPQAAHHVVRAGDGKWHCFAQFGSASLVPGVRTLLSKHVLFEPVFALREDEHLREEMGVMDGVRAARPEPAGGRGRQSGRVARCAWQPSHCGVASTPPTAGLLRPRALFPLRAE